MNRIGLIVNPIAGVGGRVGLKGSDGELARIAIEIGGVSPAPQRAIDSLREIRNAKFEFTLLTYPSTMGEDEAYESGCSPIVLGCKKLGQTTANDTKKAVGDMVAQGVDLIMFAGGDGTARNIMEILGERIPVLGIPAGVKMHSGVFAINSTLAGRLCVAFLNGQTLSKLMEVVDYDIDGKVQLFGYLQVPYDSSVIQGTKSFISAGEGDEEAIAAGILEELSDDYAYIIGPGMTAKSIMKCLDLPYTQLGVDVIKSKHLLVKDANEKQLLDVAGRFPSKILIGIVGGQGFLLGRGNQQISANVMRKTGKDNLIVVATEEKILSLRSRPLLVDTGDKDLDESLLGYVKVITGYRRAIACRIARSP